MSKQKLALGKGMGALLSSSKTASDLSMKESGSIEPKTNKIEEGVFLAPIDKVKPNKDQPRKIFKDKELIAERKSQLSQLQGQVSGLEEQLKDKEGTIETLERQLVQAGIKGKVMQASMEIDKQKNQVKTRSEKEYLETQAKQKVLRGRMSDQVATNQKQTQNDMKTKSKELDLQIKSVINNLQQSKEPS